MIEAIRDDNPVMYFFHKGIMGLLWMAYFTGSTTHVPEESYTVPFGKAKVVKEGSDVTLVTLSQMVHKSVDAAKVLEADGISVEIIDLRTLVPLDKETVLNSVTKTHRLCIADEDYLSFGLSGEIAAIVAENLDSIDLDVPVKRLGVPDVPIPYSRPLEQTAIPQVKHIEEAIRSMMN
jgi:pyruvate dehydrogenase E1 component beta subunit